MKIGSAVTNSKPHYIGHRQRILQKLYKNGYEQFADYEIVEMMLFLIFRRKDTKQLAKQLLKRFKNLNGILSAEITSLSEIEGVGVAVCNALKIINMLVKATLRSQLYSLPVINCFNDLVNYAKFHMNSLLYEEFRVIYLNNKNYVIDDRVLHRGSVNSVSFYPREIVKLCLQIGATGIIMVHNHPSGDPTPSLKDQYVTNKLVNVCNSLEIKLIDHIIVARGKYVSFKALGLLEAIQEPLYND